MQQQGFAIGNGLTNPAIQFPAYPDFALDNGIITKAEHDDISKSIPVCEQAAKTCRTTSWILLPFFFHAHTYLLLTYSLTLCLIFQKLKVEQVVIMHWIYVIKFSQIYCPLPGTLMWVIMKEKCLLFPTQFSILTVSSDMQIAVLWHQKEVCWGTVLWFQQLGDAAKPAES